MRTMARLLLAGAAGASLVFGLSPVSAQADTTDSAHFSASQQAAALRFWTPERFASAVDLDTTTVSSRATAAAPSRMQPRRPFSVPGAMAPAAAAPAAARPAAAGPLRAATSSPQRWTGGGLISTTAGKVFFYNPKTNGTYACSGDAINSDNKSVVATAGHCVVDTDGTVYQNWVFIPGYDHGNRPFGTFAATSLHWESQRIGDSDAAWDAAFATVGTVNGGRLVDTVGGQGIGFDQTPGSYVYSFGYGGSAAEGSGEQLNWCAGTEVFGEGHEGGGVWGIDCVQTGGSSGGGFLANFQADGSGMQIGNISIYVGDHEYHPYYGWEAGDAYTAAGRA